MTTYSLTQTVHVFNVATGAARSEGRQPSHDGEYVRVAYTADGQNFVAENNAGAEFSDVESCEGMALENGASDEQIAEAREIDAEVAEGIAGECGEAYPAGTPVEQLGIGYAATEYLVEAGAAKADIDEEVEYCDRCCAPLDAGCIGHCEGCAELTGQSSEYDG